MRFTLLIISLVLSFYAKSQDQNTENIPNAIRVKFQNTIELPAEQNTFTASQGSLNIGYQSADQLNSKYRATNMKRVFPYAGKFENKHRKYGLHLWYDIFVEPGTTVEELMLQYGGLSIVNVAEPIAIYKHEDFKGEELDANDPQLDNQWHYDNYGQSGGTPGADISLAEAWDEETGDSRVVVSVHDSGIDIDHPDLDDILWVNDGEIPNDNIDNDNNGYVDDYFGYNFAAAVVGGDPSDVNDYGGHGTHTSGTIAAENNNGVGVAGVAGGSGQGDGVRVMMMRLGDDSGSPYIYNPAPSFIYAADMGAVISSNSWGGGGYDQALVDAINYFTVEAGGSGSPLEGGLAIFSSGNSSSSSPDYKAELDHLMMVSASNHNDQKAWYSNYGTWVDVTAPGGETSIQNQGVLSTLPGNSYGYYQGTSMACPHVSGVAALLVSKANGTGLTNTELAEALISTADPIDHLNPSYVGQLGSGRVNALAALDAVPRGSGSSGGLIVDPIEISTEINEGESDSFTIKIVNASDYDLDVDIETTEDWISADAVNFSLGPNGVAKFNLDVDASTAGDLLNGEVTFSYLSFNSSETTVLPVEVYTLGESAISTVDTLNFGTQYVGYSVENQLEIVNSGTNYLTISNITNSSTDYDFSFSEVTLPPSSIYHLPITFTPSQGGSIIDTLQISSNDPNQSIHKLILSGSGNALSPPELSVSPQNFLLELLTGEYGSNSFSLANIGDENLSFSILKNPSEIIPLEDYGDEKTARSSLQSNEKSVDSHTSLTGVGNLVTHQKLPVLEEQALAFDGEYLWIKGDEGSSIYRYNTDSQQIIDSISSIATSSSRIDFYDGYLWEHDFGNQIIQYDLDGTVISQISLPQGNFSRGIAVDHNGIWLNSGSEFFNIDFNGAIVDQYTTSFYTPSAFDKIGNKIYGLTQGQIAVASLTDRYSLAFANYIGGHYRMTTGDLSFDGENLWLSFNDYGILVECKAFKNFVSYTYPSSGNINPTAQQSIDFNYDLRSFEEGFTYTDIIRVSTNSPVNPVIDYPISVQLTGSPQISLSNLSITIDSYIGYESTDTLTITNEGAASLLISDITSSVTDFTFSFSETELNQYESIDLPISVSMTTTDTINAALQIVSNDLNQDTTNVSLKAIGRLAPEISVDPASLDISLYEHEVDSLPITVTNTGEGQLYYYIVNDPISVDSSSVVSTSTTYSGGTILSSKQDEARPDNIQFHSSQSVTTNSAFQPSFKDLEDVLASLNENVTSITSILPSSYSFRDGETGSSISDGGNDMYDGGNRLSTNFGSYVNYTNSEIISAASYFGGKPYFTAKYDGLFVLTADLSDVNNFTIDGNLGADGGGSADGSVLSVTYQGVEWLGFVKRVFNAGDPSVNHLVIVPNNGSVNHTFSTYTDDDLHTINDLLGIGRLHYLLFAGQNGLYYNDATILNLMETYVASIENGTFYNSIDPNSSVENYVVFDGSSLDPGEYEYDVVVNSNDPLSNKTNIPTTLSVNSRPIFSTFNNSVLFDTAYVGAISYSSVSVTNKGSETLLLDNVSLSGDSEIYLDENIPDTLQPGETDFFRIRTLPTKIGDVSSSLTFETNDPLNETVEFQINGHGIESSIISLDPFITSDTLSIGDIKEYTIGVTNSGTLPLNYRITLEETVPISYLSNQIEAVWRQSGILNGKVVYPAIQKTDGTQLKAKTLTNPESIADFRVSSGGKNILIMGGDYYWDKISGILNELDASGQFGSISYLNTRFMDPGILNLEFYDAILVWNHDGHNSPTILGNMLADYVDQGGGVVTAMFENTNNELGGRWQSEFEKYTLYNSLDFGNQYGYDYAYMATAEQSNHILLENVDTLRAGYYGLRTSATSAQVSANAEIIATWNDGTPAIITSNINDIKRVDLGFYPASNNVLFESWDSSSDGTQLIVNALNFVGDGISGSEAEWIVSSTYRVEGQQAGETKNLTLTVNTKDLEEGFVGAKASFYSNDSRSISRSSYFEIAVEGSSQLEVTDTLDFKNVTLGFPKSLELPLRNLGNGSAQITVEIDTLSNYSIGVDVTDTLTIAAYGQLDLAVNFEPESTGSNVDKLIINNLTDSSKYEVTLLSEIVNPGSIRINPSTIDLTVDYQSEVQSSFTIYNEGEGYLDFLMPAFYHVDLNNSQTNNTDFISFSSIPDKGERDDRIGHPTIYGAGFDNFGYTYLDSSEPESPSYSWNDITESGTELIMDDDETENIDFKFEFPFYGVRKSSIYVGSNGMLSFEARGATSPINRQLPDASSPNGIIAPFWKDLSPNNGGTIHYLTDTDKCIVQYTSVPDYEATGTFTFQVIIHRSGDISFLFEDMNGNVNDASIGLENDFGNTGLQVAFNTDYVTNNLGVFISYPQPHISPEITAGSVAPGDSVEIPFTYQPLDKIGGAHHHELIVSSNDTVSTNSIIDIDVEVVAPTIIGVYNDTLIYDTTYINRVSTEKFWFFNDSIGALKIEDVTSSNPNFKALFPKYQAQFGTDTLDYFVDLDYNTGSSRLFGQVFGLEGEFITAKLYSKLEDRKDIIANISAEQLTGGKYSINQLISLSEDEMWLLADNSLYIDFFTTENSSGSGEVTLQIEPEVALSKNYARAFTGLYKPSGASPDTTVFNVVSNAINTEDVFITGFGTGNSSDASIDISITSIEESLSVSDSLERQFTIANIGTDSLFVDLSIANYSFESNLNPIEFSSANSTTQKSAKSHNDYMAPQNSDEMETQAVNVLSDEQQNNTLRKYYGVVNHSFGNDFSIIDPASNNEVTPLIDVSFNSFTMASEFIPGSDHQILNITWDGDLYITDINDLNQEYLGNVFGDNDWTGMTTGKNPNSLFLCTLTSLYKLDLQSLEVEFIGNFNVNRMIGIAMDKSGGLYGYDLSTDQLYKINASTGVATSIGDIGFNAEYGQDMAYDEQSDQLIMSAYSPSFGSELRVVDRTTGSTSSLGEIGPNLNFTQGASIAFFNRPSSFVKIDSVKYALAPGQTAAVNLQLNSSDLANGKHRTDIRLTSNDFSYPEIDIPVTLEVTGNNPIVGDYTDKINYGVHTVKSSITRQVTIENSGKEVLELILEENTSPYLCDYNVGDTLRVDIQSNFEFDITFYPESDGLFEQLMVWSTNDPEQPEISIQLSGASERSARELSLGFTEYQTELPRNSNENISLSIASVGLDSVNISVYLSEMADWISVDSISTTLPKDSMLTVPISISTEMLNIGAHQSQLLLISDDPMYDSLLMPITIEVINQKIELINDLPNSLIAIGEGQTQLTLADYFYDPDGDTIIYSVSSTNESVTVNQADSILALSAVQYGLDTVNIEAIDQFGDTLSTYFEVIANTRPNSESIENVSRRIDEELTEILDLNEYFSDADGDQLSFEIRQSETIADLFIGSDNKVLMRTTIQGISTVTITAFDGFHSQSESFELTIGEPLGLEEEVRNSFQIFPVPASENMTIRFSTEKTGIYLIKIMDLTGRLLRVQSKEIISGQFEAQIGVSDIPSGYYIIHILHENQSIHSSDFIKK